MENPYLRAKVWPLAKPAVNQKCRAQLQQPRQGRGDVLLSHTAQQVGDKNNQNNELRVHDIL